MPSNFKFNDDKLLESSRQAVAKQINIRTISRVDNAFVFPYNLSEEQIDYFENHMKCYVTINQQFKHSDHMIAACYNFLANKLAYDEAFSLEEDFGDIGADLRQMGASHLCTLCTDPRSLLRYLMQSNSLKGDVHLSDWAKKVNCDVMNVETQSFLDVILARTLLSNRLKVGKQDRMCCYGTQNCTKKFRVAISVNAFYDIPIEDIPLIMKNHSTELIICWMYLPDELIDIDCAAVTRNKFYRYREKDGNSYFSFTDDLSFIYVHDTKNWRKYLTTSLIECDDCMIVIEINKSIGPLCKLYFRLIPKCKYNANQLIRVMPIADRYNDYVKIPNMRFVVASNFECKFRDVPMIVVRKNIATNLFNFICKGPDGTFSFERAATYFHGMSQRLVIGNTIVHEELGLNLTDYEDVLLSITLLAAIARLRRTKTYGKAVKNFDNTFEFEYLRSHCFKRDLRMCYSDFQNSILDFFKGKRKGLRYYFNETDRNDFMMYTFEYFHNVDMNQCIRINHDIGFEAIKAIVSDDDSDEDLPVKPSKLKKALNRIRNIKKIFVKQKSTENLSKIALDIRSYSFAAFPEDLNQSLIAPAASSESDSSLITESVSIETVKSKSKYILCYQNGDLLTSNSKCIAHCISEDAEMSAGIAKQIQSKYDIRSKVQHCRKHIGQCAVVNVYDIVIYNLITKSKYFEKPTYATLELTLRECRNDMILNNVYELSMPKIGCGLDKLDWIVVSGLIDKVFKNTNIIITVFDPLCTRPEIKSKYQAPIKLKPVFEPVVAEVIKSESVSGVNVVDNESDCNIINFDEIKTTINLVIPDVVEQSILDVAVCNNNFDFEELDRSNYAVKELLFDGLINRLNENRNKLSTDNELFSKIDKCERIRQVKYRNRGQAKARELIKRFNLSKYKKIALVSYAPGGDVIEWRKARTIHGYNYVGEGACKVKWNERVNNIDYTNIKNLVMIDKYDMIFSDIGTKDSNLDILLHLDNIELGGCLMFKCWFEQISEQLISRLSSFGRVEIHKPANSLSVNNEVYFICRDYKRPFDVKRHKFNVDPLFQYYTTLLRVNAMYEMYFNNHKIDQWVDIKAEIEFEKITYDLTYSESKKFMREFDVKDVEYEQLHKIILSSLSKVNKSDVKINVNVHNAVAGSGKSDYIIENAHRKNDLIVVPTKILKNYYKSFGFSNVFTFHKALTLNRKFERVYIDEYFMLNKCYLFFFCKVVAFNDMFVFGDGSQIGNVDFNCCNYTDDDLLYVDKHINIITNRCPQDVCNILLKYDYKMKTTNLHSRSVFKIDYVLNILKTFKYIQIMTATQGAKDRYTDAFPMHYVNTIHERQGQTSADVVWVIEESDKVLLSRDEYVRVAMTRHNNTLIVYGDGNLKTSILSYYDSNIEIIAERINKPVFANDYYLDKEFNIVKFAVKPFFDINKVPVQDVVGICDKVVNLYGPEQNFASIKFNSLPTVSQGTAKVNLNLFAKTEFPVVGKALLPYNVCRRYDSKDPLAAAQTLLGRYGLTSKIFDSLQQAEAVDLLKQGINKFLLADFDSQQFKDHFVVDPEEANMHMKDYIEALNKKNLAEGELDTDFSQMLVSKGLKFIKYFMKKQTKFDAAEFALIKEKLGQGVNAWTKCMNVVFACYSRCLFKKFSSFLKVGVFCTDGLSDNAVGDQYCKFLNDYIVKNNKKPEQVENDFTEYDTSQNSVTIEFECCFLRSMQLTNEFVQLYKEHRSEWVANYPGFVSMQGRFKKHSGEPFTICFNTILNAAVCGAIYDFRGFVGGIVKGDDSHFMGDSIDLSENGQLLLSKFGMTAKSFKREVCEFTGYIITEFGFYRDVIRLLFKVLSKVHQSEEEFNEFKLAVYDSLSSINDVTLQRAGRTYLAYYYNQVLKERKVDSDKYITEADIELIENFLFNYQRINYTDLVDFKLDSIKVEKNLENYRSIIHSVV